MTRSEGQWPAQTPPDDFADRVLTAAVAERFLPRLASVRPVEMPVETPGRRPSVLRNTGVAWAMAAVIAFGTTGLYLGKIRPDQQAKERAGETALAEARAEAARKDRQIELLTQQVDQLLAALAELKAETELSELRAKIAAAQNPEVPAAKPACRCMPGDPLCSCL